MDLIFRGGFVSRGSKSERPVVRVKALKSYHSPLICESLLTVAVLGIFGQNMAILAIVHCENEG